MIFLGKKKEYIFPKNIQQALCNLKNISNEKYKTLIYIKMRKILDGYKNPSEIEMKLQEKL